MYYSICVPVWLLISMNLITGPGSVSDKPSSVTWLATRHSPFTCLLYWNLLIDTDFIHYICQFHQCCGINARECFPWASCTSAKHAGRLDCLMTSLILITMYNGRGHYMVAVLQSSQRKSQRNEKMENVRYKKTKIRAEYRDMLPRPRQDLSGTRWLRPIGLSPGSWQNNHGLGSMSQHFAQILICEILLMYIHNPCAFGLSNYWKFALMSTLISMCENILLGNCWQMVLPY